MLKDLLHGINELRVRIADAWTMLDLDALRSEIAALEAKTQQPDFWNDNENAQKTSKRLGALRDDFGAWDGLRTEANDLYDYVALAAEESSEDETIEKEVSATLAALRKRFEKLDFATLMDGEFDDRNAIIALHAGAGGTEAQDWAEMLHRMFMRYADKKGWTVKTLDIHQGNEAGIKSVTLSIEGRYAYGHFKAEAGVHRLVRISPFDSEQRRHTSFALLEVLPELEDIKEVEIDPKDIRIDTFLAGGHGGQGVQTTYSAVRITHLPTGLVVSCQNERSQTQNKETAMRILTARLHARYLAEREAEKKQLRGEFTSAEWGNQIRSYVLHPYQMVKDHRSDHETTDTEGVLNGDLDPFIDAYLRHAKAEEE
jgi:peptide chain release factor 2